MTDRLERLKDCVNELHTWQTASNAATTTLLCNCVQLAVISEHQNRRGCPAVTVLVQGIETQRPVTTGVILGPIVRGTFLSFPPLFSLHFLSLMFVYTASTFNLPSRSALSFSGMTLAVKFIPSLTAALILRNNFCTKVQTLFYLKIRGPHRRSYEVPKSTKQIHVDNLEFGLTLTISILFTRK